MITFRSSVFFLGLCLIFGLGACGGDSNGVPILPSPDNGGTVDTGTIPDFGTGGDVGAGNYPALPTSLPSVAHAGVVYVSHFHTSDLRMVRVDGATPVSLPSYELGVPGDDLALDPDNDRLFVAKFVSKQVEVLQLSRPASPSAPVSAPVPLATIPLAETPLLVRHDRALNRLYVFTAPDAGGGLLTTFHLSIYDMSNPSQPILRNPMPHNVPVTTSVALDPLRQILFLYERNSTTDARYLHVYDLLSPDLSEVPGAPLNLNTMFPQTNNTGMSIRGLTVDENQHRLYGARAQTANSELIVIDYPGALPTTTQRYGDLANMALATVIPDFFNVDLPPESRPNLLDAFGPHLDRQLGAIFFSASAWAADVSFKHAIVVPMNSALQPVPACGEFEGFGCFYKGYSNGTSVGYKATDEAACVNSTHRVFVGSSFDVSSEADPGSLHLFRYDTTLSMTPWLEADGGNPVVGGLPINAICH